MRHDGPGGKLGPRGRSLSKSLDDALFGADHAKEILSIVDLWGGIGTTDEFEALSVIHCRAPAFPGKPALPTP